MTIGLSVIIPAYNESQRLPAYLQSMRSYLRETWGGRHEVVVVDDGSKDGLQEILGQFTKTWPQLVVLRHGYNRGKGAAVRTGMLAATGEMLLFADADGATWIEEERKLRVAIDLGADVAVGCRLAPAFTAARNRVWSRDVSGRLFASAVRNLLALPVRDTQCGFKMFRRDPGLRLFRLCHEPGYLFDVEILLWASRIGYSIAEIPVAWTDMPGSKVLLLRDGARMLRGLWSLRRLMRMSTNSLCEFPATRPELLFWGTDGQESPGTTLLTPRSLPLPMVSLKPSPHQRVVGTRDISST